MSRILRSDKVKVEPNTRTFLAAVDNYLASEYINIQMEMEVLKKKDEAKKKKSSAVEKNSSFIKEMKDIAIVKDTANFLNCVVRDRGLHMVQLLSELY